MAWRKPTTDDLVSTLSQKEIDLFSKSAEFSGTDPIARQIDLTVSTVRGFISSGRKCKMSPETDSIPEMLIESAMAYAAFNLLKRMPVQIGEARTKAYERAASLFDKIATGVIVPEDYGETEEKETFTSLARPSFRRKDNKLGRIREEGI